MAKQQGREMVNEARAYRERVLTELARRREWLASRSNSSSTGATVCCRLRACPLAAVE